MKYALIDTHGSEYPVKSLCRELDVSRSLYYTHKKAKPSLHSQEDLAYVRISSGSMQRIVGRPG